MKFTFYYLSFLFCMLQGDKINCPFNNYEDGLLTTLHPIEISNYEITQGDFGFGFWSFCIPLWTVQQYPSVGEPFQHGIPEDGQLLFFLTSNGNLETIRILGYLAMDASNYKVSHKIIIKKSDDEFYEHEFFFDPATYEGRWIFTLITFVISSSQTIIEITEQNRLTTTLDFTTLNQIQLIVGGRGKITINQNTYNLNIFLGRLSQVIQNNKNFEELAFLCKRPPKLEGEQTLTLIQGLQNFDGSIMKSFVIDQVGNRYCLSGWVKYDPSQIVTYIDEILLRLTTFKNYQMFTNFGDELFRFQIFLYTQVPYETSFSVVVNPYAIPSKGKLDYDYATEYDEVNTYFIDLTNENYFNGLTQWHFLQYEYGRTGEESEKMLLKIQFFNELGLIIRKFNAPQRRASFINSEFYLYFGGDNYQLQLLQAAIYNFKFEYNYQEDKSFFIEVCHYSCTQCDGPLINNCLQCDSNSHRQYLEEQRVCKCEKGFIDSSDTMICKQFSEEYSSVVLDQIMNSEYISCQSGYFQLLKNDNSFLCIECPQHNFNDILCADCYYYPQSWYQKPICTVDLISRKEFPDDAFSTEVRQDIEYDVYLIDETYNLILLDGVFDFCDNDSDPFCHQTNFKHLGNPLIIQCKKDYFFTNQQCVKPDSQCISSTAEGKCQQCDSGLYLLNNKCQQCPSNCITCEYDQNKEQPICLSCQPLQSVVEGQCQQCGSYCEICQNFYDQILNQSYLKCYKCIDDQQYLLSIDAINCVVNKIKNCQYAFQALASDITINTIDIYFTPQVQSSNIITYCGLCTRGYILVMPTQTCILQFDGFCDFGYSLDPNFKSDGPDDYLTYKFNCLVAIIEISSVIQFNDYCIAHSNNCDTCLLGQSIGYYSCITCMPGYYSERLTEKCISCPIELHCFQCIQQDILRKDGWKTNIRAFYRQFIDVDNTHPFILYGQSAKVEDFEVTCSFCQSGYELLNYKCIKSCPVNCLECKLINGEKQCVKCKLEYQGRGLSLINNQCIQCPGNCALCRIRSLEQIAQINPLFNDSDLINYSYHCLKSFDDQSYYYDQELGQFLSCDDNNVGCKQEFVIPLNLYCSQDEYQQQLNYLLNDDLKKNFRQTNILGTDLFSGQSFKEFYNNEFYTFANQNLIKKIQLQITCQKAQICLLQGSQVVEQSFSIHIFSAIEVQIEFNFKFPVTFQYDKTIVFKDFSKIQIEGVIFEPLNTNKLKQIIFLSEWPQQINWNLIKYQQKSEKQEQSQIIFQNLQSLSINQLEFINIRQTMYNNFFIIKSTDSQKTIKLSNIVFKNCFFQNSQIFTFDLASEDIVNFDNIEIQSKFQNSSLISLSNSIGSGFLNLKSITIQNTELVDCLSFLDLYKFQKVKISGVKLQSSTLMNSVFITVNQIIELEDTFIIMCEFRKSSFGIKNSNILMQYPIQLQINNLNFQNNNYDETIKLLSFKGLSAIQSFIIIKQLYLIGNSAVYISPDFNFQQTNSSLCYFQVMNIIIDGLEIQRGSGLPELTFTQIKNLNVNHVLITQHKRFQFLGLHHYLDCLQKQIEGKYYPTSIFIYSAEQTIFDHLEIRMVEIMDYHLIIYLSAELSEVKQKESLQMQNFQITQNLLLVSQVQKSISLFQIQSSQDIQVKIVNVKFEKNHLHEYIQNELLNSATIFILKCIQGDITLQNSEFNKNLVTNSSNSILYINSKSTQILNCKFSSNGIFDYQILQPYLLWGYATLDAPINSIKNIFPVFQQAGNGIIIGETIKILDSEISNSQGSQGGGLSITAQNNAQISINGDTFSEISTHFTTQGEQGGVLYVDGQKALSLIYQMANTSASNIYSRNQGGLLYINLGVGQANLILVNITANNIYSIFGSLVFAQFSSLSTFNQRLFMNQIFLRDTEEGFYQFLNKFINKKQQEIQNLMNNRSLVYTSYGNQIIFRNAKISNLFYESLLSSMNSKNIQITNLNVENSQISRNLINIYPISTLPTYIEIKNIMIQNLQVGQLLMDQQCNVVENSQQVDYFQCLAEPQIAPLGLLDDQEYLNFNRVYCLLEQMKSIMDEENLGLFILNDQASQCKVKLFNIAIQNIECKKCQNGLIGVFFSTYESIKNQIINSFTISHCNCGTGGCIIYANKLHKESRILQQNDLNLLDYELIVSDYTCINNTAKYGTCLKVKNMNTLLSNCFFKENNASLAGGAIYFEGNQKFIIQTSLIEQNQASIGGGLSFNDALISNYSRLKTQFVNNTAILFAETFASIPSQLSIQINENDQIFSTISIEKTDKISIDQVVVTPYKLFGNSLQNILYLPSGQEIVSYQYFNWRQQTYNQFKWKLRLIPLNQRLTPQKMLSGTSCSIQSRLLNISNKSDNQPFMNNFTNLKQIYFNESTQDYNLDNIIITFDSETPSELVLQLQFQCDSIKVPIYNNNYPYNIIDFHKNYFLRLNVRTFSCQLGEIKENQSCIQCDFNQGLFSLKINSNKCEIKNEETTIDVKPAQLNIRPGYWRPYLDTSDVSFCLNLQENCQGGWIQGDTSCYVGHIGALCEQCDLSNIRGDGHFSVSTTYSCGSCQEQSRNSLLIFAISTWTLISILISVRSTLDSIKQNVRTDKIVPLGFKSPQSDAYSAIYIKILTNYLQILACIATFELKVPAGFNYTINAVGNPLQSAAYSLDCFLISIFNVEIHYARMIWQFILPQLYISLLFLLFTISVKLRIVAYSKSVITTTLIYMYIYLQPNLVGGIIQLISYRNISGYLWVSANVAYRFDTWHHLEWVLRFALPGLVIVAFAIPALMFNGLKSNRLKLDQIQTKLNWGYLYNEYKKDAYFWEIVKIFQKELIIIFLQFYEQTVVVKAVLIMLVMFIYQELNNKFQPYTLRNLNSLDSFSAKICYISIGIAIGIYAAEQQQVIEIQGPFFMLLGIINSYFIFSLISRIVLEYITEADQKDEKIDKIRDKIRNALPCLEKIPFFKRALKNRNQQKGRIQKQFQKIRSFLLPKAKQMIALKSQWNLYSENENVSRYKGLGSPASDSVSGLIRQTGRETQSIQNNNNSQIRTDSMNATQEIRESNIIIDLKQSGIRPSKFKFMQQD